MPLSPELAHLLRDQSGVIARNQVRALGGTDDDIRRLCRRRHWNRIHPGIYIEHTGPPTWQQKAWAAVLYADGVLCGPSALRAADGPGRSSDDRDSVVHVAIRAERRVRPQPGLRVVRRRGLEDMALWNTSPPRQRYEDAALDVALESSGDMEALAVLAEGCQGRRTTAARLRASLDSRARAPRRSWLSAVLDDIAAGSCSVLEQEYLRRVERAHGLPVGTRQERAWASVGVIYRDVSYRELVIELDGRLFHDSAAARDRDMERDLDAALDGKSTLRLGWGQVHQRPCTTAGKIGIVLRQRGWRGELRACGSTCTIAEDRRQYSSAMFHDRVTP